MALGAENARLLSIIVLFVIILTRFWMPRGHDRVFVYTVAASLHVETTQLQMMADGPFRLHSSFLDMVLGRMSNRFIKSAVSY